MREVPDITTSRSDIVVDHVQQRRRWLGLLGEKRWIVHWRSTKSSSQRSKTFLHGGQRAGGGTLAEAVFSFTVRWRGDLRRQLLRAPTTDFYRVEVSQMEVS